MSPWSCVKLWVQEAKRYCCWLKEGQGSQSRWKRRRRRRQRKRRRKKGKRGRDNADVYVLTGRKKKEENRDSWGGGEREREKERKKENKIRRTKKHEILRSEQGQTSWDDRQANGQKHREENTLIPPMQIELSSKLPSSLSGALTLLLVASFTWSIAKRSLWVLFWTSKHTQILGGRGKASLWSSDLRKSRWTESSCNLDCQLVALPCTHTPRASCPPPNTPFVQTHTHTHTTCMPVSTHTNTHTQLHQPSNTHTPPLLHPPTNNMGHKPLPTCTHPCCYITQHAQKPCISCYYLSLWNPGCALDRPALCFWLYFTSPIHQWTHMYRQNFHYSTIACKFAGYSLLSRKFPAAQMFTIRSVNAERMWV